MPVVSADGIRDVSLSEDGKSATFSLTTKYTSDIVVTIPAECLNALRMAAERSAPATGAGKFAVSTTMRTIVAPNDRTRRMSKRSSG